MNRDFLERYFLLNAWYNKKRKIKNKNNKQKCNLINIRYSVLQKLISGEIGGK